MLTENSNVRIWECAWDKDVRDGDIKNLLEGNQLLLPSSSALPIPQLSLQGLLCNLLRRLER